MFAQGLVIAFVGGHLADQGGNAYTRLAVCSSPYSESHMRTLAIVLVGIVAGWAASGVDWSREAVGQEKAPDAIASLPSDPLVRKHRCRDRINH